MTGYLIWSNEHSGWWDPCGNGYVRHVAEAGRYTREAALEVCRKAVPGQWTPGLPFPELPVAEVDALALEAEGRDLAARAARR